MPASSPVLDPTLRRSYDLRGTVGSNLRERDAHALGRRFAALAREEGADRIAVSRDGRSHSPALERALVRGLMEGGAQVVRLPPGPTPLVSFAIHRLGLGAGVMVTGSHNPPEQNGFKLWLGEAPFTGESLQRLWRVEPRPAPGGSEALVDPAEYVDALLGELAGIALPPCAWDCGSGATGPVVERLLTRLGRSQRALFTTMDGSFPFHHPDPSVASNLALLAQTVVENHLELGVAFDGDGDRVGIVDGHGEIVWADQMLLLLARDVLQERPGSAIVADVKCSQVVFDGIAAAGGRPVMAASGYVRVREAMLREGAPLAGEMSGHVFFGDRWHHADDGLYVALRVMRALARAGTSLGAFRTALPPSFATPELRLPCADARKAEVLLRLADYAARTRARIDRLDGLRVADERGWWLARASGTEGKLTVRCEARSAGELGDLCLELAGALEEAGIDGSALELIEAR